MKNKLLSLRRLSLLIVMMATCLAQTAAAEWQESLFSPDGRLELRIYTRGELAYSLLHRGKVLIDKSPIGLQMEGDAPDATPKVRRVSKKGPVREDITAPHYRFASFSVTYNTLSIRMKGDLGVEFRAYNEGVAYRFTSTRKSPFTVRNERAEMRFPKDYPAYMAYTTARQDGDPYAMAFQNIYAQANVSRAERGRIAFLPVTLDCGEGVKLTLLESDLEKYPGMFVKGGREGEASLVADFAPYPLEMKAFPPRAMKRVTKRADFIAKADGARTFPWRIWAVTEKDTDMPVNPLVYALASENRIGDTTWIETGKVAWDWWNDWGISGVDFKAGINMPTYKYYIDFAAKNGIEFVVLDEGWYDPAKGDMLTVVPQLNLEELVAYAKGKGVKLMLWTVFNVLDSQLEAACKKYSAMGISGFKVDFLDRDDQTGVEMTYRLAEATAKYHLTLDLHGFYKPTGLDRTFPNIINFEAVFGMEEMKWRSAKYDMMEYDVTMPFIRMMAGPVDYTPGAMRNATKRDFRDVYYNPMSQGTRCHQLATYVVHDSPLTMLADNPTAYMKEQECTDFIVSLPNRGIDETRVLQGKLGECIVTARRVGKNWYVGGMTDWNARDISLDFSFLKEGTYRAVLFRDGENAEKQATDYRKETFSVTPDARKDIHMAPGGGFAMTFIRE